MGIHPSDPTDAPLARFDQLRTDDPSAALAGYAAHLDALTADDVDRLDWICRQDLRQRLEFEPLLQAAWRAQGEPRFRRRVGGTLALIAQMQGRADDAKHLLQQTLAIERDDPDDAWLRACLNLSLSFGQDRRVLESLILARRAIDVAERIGDRHWGAFAWKRYCGTLVLIEDAERLEQALAHAERAAEVLADGPAAEALGVELLFARAELARIRGDSEVALELLALCEARGEAMPSGRYYVNAARVQRAFNLLRLRRHAEAEASLASLEDPVSPDLARHAALDRVRCRLVTGGRDAALALAEDAIRGLEAEPAGVRYHDAVPLGRYLAEEVRDPFLARRAFELASTSLLTLVTEVELCIRELPEIQEATPDVPEILADYRTRLSKRHGALMSTVAKSLTEQLVRHDPERPDDDRIAMCAWCHDVQVPGRRWLPISHFVPASPDLQVSHGICTRCAHEYF
ncbi:MAG: hypothetical protein QNJ98_00805 [Planctomycetota bacterium]|nr:hypothetical protein [Planctomycetota bacterium]